METQEQLRKLKEQLLRYEKEEQEFEALNAQAFVRKEFHWWSLGRWTAFPALWFSSFLLTGSLDWLNGVMIGLRIVLGLAFLITCLVYMAIYEHLWGGWRHFRRLDLDDRAMEKYKRRKLARSAEERAQKLAFLRRIDTDPDFRKAFIEEL